MFGPRVLAFVLLSFSLLWGLGCQSPISISNAPSTVSDSRATSVNLAAGKNAVASSVEKAGLEASKAVDSDQTTRWSSAFSDPQWIYVDLVSAQPVSRVVLNWETAAAQAYQIQTSTDLTNWTSVYSTSSGTSGIRTVDFPSTTARYVRVWGTARTTVYGYSLYDFAVYNTLVPSPSPSPSPSPTPTVTPSPAPGKPIPGTIEAEAWDGMSGLQVEPTSDIGGGQDVGYTDPSDWLEYKISVASTGSYIFDFRTAAPQNTSSFDVLVDNNKQTTIFPAQTNGWQNWQTVSSQPISLTAGSHTLKLVVGVAGFNLNWLSGRLNTTVSNVTNLGAQSSDSQVKLNWNPPTDPDFSKVQITYAPNGPTNPILVPAGTNSQTVVGLTNGTTYTFTVKAVSTSGATSSGVSIDAKPNKSKALPGQFQAEDLDLSQGIQLEACSDTGGGQDVGYIDAGDFLEYAVSASTSSFLRFDYRVASLQNGGTFDVLLDNSKVDTVDFTASGGWQTWKSVSGASIWMTAGNHTVRFAVTKGGFNVNWVNVVTSTTNVLPVTALTRSYTGFVFTEGPATDSQGNTYFSDQNGNNVYKIDAGGTLSLFLANSQGMNGLMFDGRDRLIGCQGGAGRIVAIDLATKAITPLASTYNGNRFNRPNDLVIDAQGGIYFTDPVFGEPMYQDVMGVYYVAPNKTVTRVISNINQPNGIILSPDGSKLYVTATGIMQYSVVSPGVLGTGSLLIDLGSNGADGMSVDTLGNLYTTPYGKSQIQVISPAGVLLGSFAVPEVPTNVEFGGADRKKIFITAGKSVYTATMDTTGYRFLGIVP